MGIKKVAEYVWLRHQGHWNWIIMVSTALVFFMALCSHSVILFFVFVVGCVVSLLELPAPVPPFARIAKIIRAERNWLNSPWKLKKWLQAFGVFVAVVYVSLSCWEGSIMAILLFVGICAGIACVYGNKAMGVDEL